MYPYATTALQEQIIQQQQTTNTKLDNILNGINNTGILIASIILIIAVKKLVLKCLGEH